MFKRKSQRPRPVEEWPVSQIVDHAVFCLASDVNVWEVRGAIVLHHDPELLPDSVLRELEENSGGVAEYVALLMFFEEKDAYGLIEGRTFDVVKEMPTMRTLDEAKQAAHEWVGETAKAYEFQYMPGLYQAAFVQAFTGHVADLDPVRGVWATPSGRYMEGETGRADEILLVRDFPLRTEDRARPKDAGGFKLVPVSGYQQLLRLRGY